MAQQKDQSTNNEVSKMTKHKNNPAAWILVEERTDARDGNYFNKTMAENVRGHLQATWKGSKWSLIPVSHVESIGVRFHTEKPMHERLVKLYGPEDYAAADRYDESLRGE